MAAAVNAVRFQRLDPPRNTLRALFDLELNSGMRVHGFTLHQKGESAWIGLPAAPQLDDEGRHRKHPITGKGLWAPIVEIPDPVVRARFQREALVAVHVAMADDTSPAERGFGPVGKP